MRNITKIISETNKERFEATITEHINDGWEVAGFSVNDLDGSTHYNSLLIKKGIVWRQGVEVEEASIPTALN